MTRWEQQDELDDMQVQLEQSPDAMQIRGCTIEHPFRTIKSWMGTTHFLTKGLERVKTEVSLHMLASWMRPTSSSTASGKIFTALSTSRARLSTSC